VLSLCERIGYYGAFECEFIQAGDRYLLIDFNARFYNQLGLDVARGLDLPKLVYAAARGQVENVDKLISVFEKRETGRPYAFCNSFQFGLVTRTRRGLGAMSQEEASHWHEWLGSSERSMVDATFDIDDRLPYAVDAASQLYSSVRYLRGFLRDCRTK